MLWKLEWKKLINKNNVLWFVLLIFFYGLIIYAYQPNMDYSVNEKKLLYESLNKSEHPYESFVTMKEQLFATEDITLSQLSLFQDITKQLEHYDNYSQYVETIKKNAKKSGMAIFANRSEFDKANANKTYQDYCKMDEVELSFVVPDGFEESIVFPLMDFLLLMISVMSVLVLLLKEKQNNMLLLYRTMKEGRSKLIISKLSVISVVLFISVVGLVLVNILCGSLKYGMIDFNASIMSYSLFKEACLNIDIKTFYLIFILMKWFSYTLLATIFLIFAIQANNINRFYLDVIGLFLVSAICYMFLPNEGLLSWFKYVNLIPYLLVYPIFLKYWNLNFFNMPIEQNIVYVLMTIIFLIGFMLLCIYLFSRNRMNSSLKTKKSLIFDLPVLQKGIIANEAYKLFVLSKGFIYTLLFIIVSFFCINSMYPSLSEDALRYQTYMQSLEGDLTVKKSQIIEAEKQRFQQLDNMLVEKSTAFSEGKISDQEMASVTKYYSDHVQGKVAFEMVLQQYEDRSHNSEYPMLYEKGYEELFAAGYTKYSTEMLIALILTIYILFMSSSFLCEEHQSGMIHLLEVQFHNEKKVYKVKTMILYGVLLFSYIFIYGLQFLRIQETYGMSLWDTNMNAILSIRGSLNLSCNQYFIILHMIRLIGYMVYLHLIIKISNRFKKNEMVLGMCIISMIIPIALHVAGISILDMFSFNSIFSGNMLIHQPIFGCVFIIVSLVVIIKKVFQRKAI